MKWLQSSANSWLILILISWPLGMLNAGQGTILGAIDVGVTLFAAGTAFAGLCICVVPFLSLVLRENDPRPMRRSIILARTAGVIAGLALTTKCIEFTLTANHAASTTAGWMSTTARLAFVVFTSIACWFTVRELPRARCLLARRLGHVMPAPTIRPVRKPLAFIVVLSIITFALALRAADSASLLGPVAILWITTATIRSVYSPLDAPALEQLRGKSES